jgi:hypothetical protein
VKRCRPGKIAHRETFYCVPLTCASTHPLTQRHTRAPHLLHTHTHTHTNTNTPANTNTHTYTHIHTHTHQVTMHTPHPTPLPTHPPHTHTLFVTQSGKQLVSCHAQKLHAVLVCCSKSGACCRGHLSLTWSRPV